MARLLWSVGALVLMAVAAARSGPIDGSTSLSKVRIDPSSKKEISMTFQAGKRACVIAVGQRIPPADVAISVYDEGDQPVAEDRGLGFAAAVWYPPRDAKYKIVVSNPATELNEMYLVFK